ncbi:16S rRNA (cytosine(1402)-N(4))-methyltransferase RsmH [Mycoplasma bradburyae]|uniref:Ribosomal RNA small subunit methyltransferase H n=1 Tax=Mycoplasma bradburyae TaxID=2963128 RepID=A0ABT5GAK8_9MOLU|nr:16S rRNA (cytosine(1402)-N(4))-methyltransferase RsmH [Mycoplasma bradburyae]MDC4182006.1 16S rRNA (cytosine(1402)-N(4))-methyltransferase RsmH [Mycoplasma bradburyae]UTS70431.1 16S rRNA (cytosine(1402)-N(4))-methyltransferase RsmH [Mycoplasma bradburyae]
MIINNQIHYPVLLKEVIDNIITNKDGIYLDLTIGFGGHSYNIINALSDKAKLFGFDQDYEAINHCNKLFEKYSNVKLIKDNFANLKDHLKRLEINKIDGCLIDLGVSSYQLDQPKRGFSYHSVGRFDMRMDQDQKLDATELIKTSSVNQLITIFKKYGEIKDPFRVANELKRAFEQKDLNTLEVVELIKANVKKEELYSKKHPARKYFQAIRIAVNKELDVLEKVLTIIPELLNVNGRLLIISFHSLEEKLIKKAFRNLTSTASLTNIPLNNEELLKYKNHYNKGLEPSKNELETNKRSRSAKLFVLERIKE